MKYKRYEKYKDSGVEWIGEIPEGWETTKVKYVSMLKNGEFISKDDFDDNGEYPIYGSNGIIGKGNKINVTTRSIVIGRVGACGEVHVLNKGWVSDNALIVNLLRRDIDFNYFYYFLLASNLPSLASKTAQPLITGSKIKNIILLKPSFIEQTAIANFLDQKTAEIDSLIADKEKMIQLLKEKRQAIISEAVTKGLDRNVPMKDSGVEWIGEIPEHWEIKKIKYISNITMGQSPKSEECSLDEIGLPFLQGNAEFTSLHPIPKIYCNTANKFSKVNDILLSVRAPVGAMNISDRVYGIGRGLCAITANKVQVRYLWYSMNVSLEELFIKSKGSTFEAVTVTDVNNLLSILPPKNEQIAIANFLDQKTTEIDSLISDIKTQIDKLKEYRQSLIFEAVTGKINVRDFS